MVQKSDGVETRDACDIKEKRRKKRKANHRLVHGDRTGAAADDPAVGNVEAGAAVRI